MRSYKQHLILGAQHEVPVVHTHALTKSILAYCTTCQASTCTLSPGIARSDCHRALYYDGMKTGAAASALFSAACHLQDTSRFLIFAPGAQAGASEPSSR